MRAIQGDVEGLDELATCLLRILIPRLRRTHRRAPVDFLSDATEDAILEYGKNPERFDPARGVPLDRFVQLAATRNLANLLQADARRRKRDARYLDLQPVSTNLTKDLHAGEEDGKNRQKWLSIVNRGPERRALITWLEGERRTDALAAILEISHLPQREQRREVKRFKDRILKRASRYLVRQRRRK